MTAPRTNTPLDHVLRDAHLLADAYRDYQPPTAEQRLVRARARRTQHAVPGDHPAAAVPNLGPEHEQARHELDLTSTLVLNTPRAEDSLARLIESLNDADGALVFACLLHLTAREDGARFWWKFAAGAGNATAAFCLYLDHRRNAEYRDADYWRTQSLRLRADLAHADAVHPGGRPLPARRQLRDLLAACHRGLQPHLPLSVEGAINQLPVNEGDALDGHIPTPAPHLITTLRHCT
ncbi:MAG: hypothetical protein ACRDVE_08330 [Actinocrinis sp.]